MQSTQEGYTGYQAKDFTLSRIRSLFCPPFPLSLSVEILPAAFAARVDDGVPITIE